MNVAVLSESSFTEVDGLKIRFIEEGSGTPAILLHGTSLGSSADVFRRNLPTFAANGIRAIAVDFPGFGQSSPTDDLSAAYRKRFVLGFMDALDLEKAAIIAHSSAGNTATNVALEYPDRVTHLVILGTGSLLPPLETAEAKVGGREEAAQARLENRMVQKEPTLEDTRALLEANLFHHELITEDELQLRHRNSIGQCFTEFVRRHDATNNVDAGGKKKASAPLWQRLGELKMPLLMIYGREDRGRAADRVELLRRRNPDLNLHVADGCKHLVPWDAANLVHSLTVPFLKK